MVQNPHVRPISLVFRPIGKFNLLRTEQGSSSIPLSRPFSPFLWISLAFPNWERTTTCLGGGVASPPASQCFPAQITPDSIIYRTLLNYDPSPASNPVIIRSNPAVIPIECHYPR